MKSDSNLSLPLTDVPCELPAAAAAGAEGATAVGEEVSLLFDRTLRAVAVAAAPTAAATAAADADADTADDVDDALDEATSGASSLSSSPAVL